MSFVRHLVRDGAMTREVTPGDASPCNYVVSTNSVDADSTISVQDLMGGLYVRDSITANRTDTLPTAAEILAALDGMNVGDTFSAVVLNADAGSTLTVGANTGLTLVADVTVNAFNNSELVFLLTDDTVGSEAFTVYAL